MDEVNKNSPSTISEFDALVSEFKDIPEFEPINQEKLKEEQLSLNDSLKQGVINIGLNDKIAFLNQLFSGDNKDYENVLAQLNSFTSLGEAEEFLAKEVKPNYNNWEGKTDLEERLMEILATRFK